MDQIFKRKIRSLTSSGQLTTIDIRRLDETSLQSIRMIASESFDKVWSEKDFSFFVSHALGLCYGAFLEDELIGYFMGLLTQGELDIVSVAVLKKFRRCSVAQSLIECLLSLPEVKRSFLEVEAGNISAIRLYEKMGFKKYGLRKKYYAGVKDAVLMKREG